MYRFQYLLVLSFSILLLQACGPKGQEREFPEQGKKQAVLVGKWKLVYLHKANKYELYHLSEDVDENENLIEENPEIFQELKEKMENARIPSEEFPF